jgi:polyisoprenoid-binding protein YceI
VRSVVLAVALSFILARLAVGAPDSRDPVKAPAGVYELDPRHASLIVRVARLGFSRYTMRFTSLSGAFTYDPADWRNTKVVIRVDPKSIDTEDGRFGKTIVGYFEPDRYPVIEFASTTLTSSAEGQGELTGYLTLHGVTKPVTLHVTFNGAEPGLPGGGTHMSFSGAGRIRRSRFNVTGGWPWAGDNVDLQFDVEFVRK